MRRPVKLWQRNAIGAVVAVVSLAVIVAVDLAPKWSDYRATMQPAVLVPPRQSVTVDGQTWSIGEVRHVGRRVRPLGAPLPAGTVVTVVTVQRSGTPQEAACTGVLSDGTHRWRGQPPSRYGLREAADAAPSCAKPGPLQWAFVIPDDVVPTAVDITTLDGSIAVRLQL